MNSGTSHRRLDQGKWLLVALGVWLVASIAVFGAGPWRTLTSWDDNAFLFDVRADYSNQEAIESLSTFGTYGRQLFAWFLACDSLWATLQGLVIGWLGLFAIRRWRGRSTRWQWLAFAPLVLTAIDLMENLQIALMLASFPDVPAWMTAVTAGLTNLKLGLIPVLPLTILASLTLLPISVWRNRRRAHPGSKRGSKLIKGIASN